MTCACTYMYNVCVYFESFKWKTDWWFFFYFVNIALFDWPPFFFGIDFIVIMLHKTVHTPFFWWLFLDSLLFSIPFCLISHCVQFLYTVMLPCFLCISTESHRWLGLHVFLCGKWFPATSAFSGDQVKCAQF